MLRSFHVDRQIDMMSVRVSVCRSLILLPFSKTTIQSANAANIERQIVIQTKRENVCSGNAQFPPLFFYPGNLALDTDATFFPLYISQHLPSAVGSGVDVLESRAMEGGGGAVCASG
jgi:hypothetical protein